MRMLPRIGLLMLLPFLAVPLARAASDGQILFISDRTGKLQIYVMNGDGSEQTRLTNSRYEDTEPDWSPDGSRIAFTSNRGGNLGDIYVMNVDGSGVTRLTHTEGAINFSKSPAWSSDGSKIAYTNGGTLAPFSRIYTVNSCIPAECARAGLPSPSRSRAMRASDPRSAYSSPAWSPDGSNIAVTQLAGRMFIAVSKILVMNAKGRGEHELTSQPASEDQAAWSPDGSKVAFAGYLQSGTWEIYVVNANGSNEVRITNNRANDFVPTWSPDGSQIAFTSNRSGRFEVYVVNADGSNLRQLTHEGGGNPDWGLAGDARYSGDDYSDSHSSDTSSNSSGSSVSADSSDSSITSGSSDSPVLVQVTFANDTSAPVVVVWVDFEGREQPYYVLQPGTSYTQSTYPTHQWRFKQGELVLGEYTVRTLAEQSWTIQP